MGHVTPRRRALLALGSGFVFGFSCLFDFSGKVQFGGSHPVVSAAAFDAGAVLAVVVAIALLVPVLSLLFRFAKTERVEMIVISALAADTAWGWLEERWAQLSKVPFPCSSLRCQSAGPYAQVPCGFGSCSAGLLWFADGWLKSRHFPPKNCLRRDKDRTPI